MRQRRYLSCSNISHVNNNIIHWETKKETFFYLKKRINEEKIKNLLTLGGELIYTKPSIKA